MNHPLQEQPHQLSEPSPQEPHHPDFEAWSKAVRVQLLSALNPKRRATVKDEA